jgi:hypothetical protein
LPKDDIEEAQKEFLLKRGSELKVLWISWRLLPKLFENKNTKIIQDIVTLLIKCGLTFFDGFHLDPIKVIGWRIDTTNIKMEKYNPFWAKWHLVNQSINWTYSYTRIPYLWDHGLTPSFRWRYQNV